VDIDLQGSLSVFLLPINEIYKREMDKLFERVALEILVHDFLIHSED